MIAGFSTASPPIFWRSKATATSSGSRAISRTTSGTRCAGSGPIPPFPIASSTRSSRADDRRLERPPIPQVRGRAHPSAARSSGASAAQVPAPRRRPRLWTRQLHRASDRALSAGASDRRGFLARHAAPGARAAAQMRVSLRRISSTGIRRSAPICCSRTRCFNGCPTIRRYCGACLKRCPRAPSWRCRCPTTRTSRRLRSCARWRQAGLGPAARPDGGRARRSADTGSLLRSAQAALSRLDIWHTVYNHVMAGADAIVEWFRGSALRPFLARSTMNARAAFSPNTPCGIAQAYPPRYDGSVLLRFPRCSSWRSVG